MVLGLPCPPLKHLATLYLCHPSPSRCCLSSHCFVLHPECMWAVLQHVLQYPRRYRRALSMLAAKIK